MTGDRGARRGAGLGLGPRRGARLGLVGVLIALLATPLAATAAFAHDSLIDATPADGSTVTSLTDVALTYSGAILGDEGANIVQVVGPDARYYETACPTLAGPVVTTPVTLGVRGTYEVLWRVVSSDGHPVSGSYTFDYQPEATADAGAAGSDAPLCGTPAEAGAEPASAEPGPDLGLWVGLGIGAAVAAVVALIAWRLIRSPQD